ncbi:MAG: fibronectin type III domain-containing protein [Treponema bryantii]|nr:fibronectin type III domain-containing protein [Treponema bryantii]
MKKSICIFLCLIFSICVFSQERPVVKDITAKYLEGTSIQISWTNPQNPQPQISFFKLYRTIKPISTYKQLSDKDKIADLSPNTNSYIDNLFDFKEYYYTLIACTPEPNTLIFASMNTTTSSVKIEPAEENEQNFQSFKTKEQPRKTDLREMPLPYLNIVEGINQKSGISENAINKLPLQDKNVKNDEYIHPYIFQEDLYTPDGGDDFILFEILKNYFIQEKYDQAFISLQHLTKTNVDEKVLNRAIFYMGQSLYFCANYEEAITTFVKVAEIYPELTKKWIILSLDALNLHN